MRLDLLDVQVKQDSDTFMLTLSDSQEYVLKAMVDGEWVNQYAFDLSRHEWIDFVPANYLNSTHPDAVFVQKLLIVLHDQAGRKILFGDTLKIVKNGQTEQRTIFPGDRISMLSREFGLDAAER
jgi:N-hydroxyarylamine O-acetyltransferase